jgi:hypothetical protein
MSQRQGSTQPAFDLASGLRDYYSSQADLMLAQFDNINQLLGPTTNWTHPGELCENLLRDFLRRFLPPSFAVDKGFVYGRAALEGEETHCPEIDILVHDCQEYRPLFRMGDFAIVQPQSVRAMIQVKRALTRGQINKGLRNVVQAKQHLLNVLWSGTDRRSRGWVNSGIPPRVFTAVIGFQDRFGRDLSFYRERLLEWHKRHRTYDQPNMIETNMYVLPAFVGSLQNFFLYLSGPGNFELFLKVVF